MKSKIKFVLFISLLSLILTLSSVITISTEHLEEYNETYVYTIMPLKININTADASELIKLKGIGTVTANAIIIYREENGNFKSEDELLNVNGIGNKKLDDIIDNICI